MKPKFKSGIKILAFLCLLGFVYRSSGYIERRYTLQEVIESCTNIVFGTIKSVDSKRLRAIIKVDEDVLGESGLEKIKINLAVGQRRPETSPEKMAEYFREGKPAVIFYDMHSGQLNSLGHVGGKWFQCKTYVGKKWEDSNWRDKWWNFTHLEIHLYHAYKGWTVNLQKKVRELVKDMDTILAPVPTPTIKAQASKAQAGHVTSELEQSVEKRSPSILQELESGDTKTRKNAVQQLANLGHSAALLTALDDPELSIRKLAVQKIIKLDSSQGLVVAMNDQNPLIREMAARKLVKKFDIHGLEKVYNDSNEKIRNIALEALEENPSFTITIMLDALNSYDNLIRNFATAVLEDMTGENSVDEFYEWRQNRLDPGLLMTLYQGVDFENKAASRVSSSVELNQEMDEFDRNVTDGFSVRWIGYLSVPENEIYLFTVRHNGAIKFWIDGEELISNKSISPKEKTDLKALHLKKGYHSIRLEYRNNANDGLILLLWNSGLRDLVIPEENMFHLARAANR